MPVWRRSSIFYTSKYSKQRNIRDLTRQFCHLYSCHTAPLVSYFIDLKVRKIFNLLSLKFTIKDSDDCWPLNHFWSGMQCAQIVFSTCQKMKNIFLIWDNQVHDSSPKASYKVLLGLYFLSILYYSIHISNITHEFCSWPFENPSFSNVSLYFL